jgi:hypothetical protein
MIDEEFRRFVASNTQSLDELHRMFAELRLGICEEFWDQLGAALKVGIPDGYSYIFSGKAFSSDERTIGWRKNIAGNINVSDQRDVYVAFGCGIQPEALALGEWPLYRPWTGIKVWLDKGREREKKLLDAIDAKRPTVKTELPGIYLGSMSHLTLEQRLLSTSTSL